jgi:hypothetical protein
VAVLSPHRLARRAEKPTIWEARRSAAAYKQLKKIEAKDKGSVIGGGVIIALPLL